MTSSVSPEWVQISKDALLAASRRQRVDDFKLQCKIAKPTAGMSYFDRMRAAESLIKSGVIRILDDKFQVVSLENATWLTQLLGDGDTSSWEFIDALKLDNSTLKKFDDTLLKDLGERGEAFMIEMIKNSLDPSLHSRIKHVALSDDTLGFDVIAPDPRDSQSNILLEVKTSSRPKPNFRFYLSRNEYETGLSRPNWWICCIRLNEGFARLEGMFQASELESKVPNDASAEALWQSTLFSLDISSHQPYYFSEWFRSLNE
jgi:hypothetical protein